MSEKIEGDRAVIAHTALLMRAEQNFQRQLDWIGRFDARSATILGIGIAMLGFLSTEAPPPEKWELYCYILSVVAVLPLFVSLGGIYFGQYPRTSSPNDSLIYFGTIAKLDVEEFLRRCREQSEDQHLWDLCNQTHLNSLLMSKKFTALKVALVSLLVAIVPWAVTIIHFRIVKG